MSDANLERASRHVLAPPSVTGLLSRLGGQSFLRSTWQRGPGHFASAFSTAEVREILTLDQLDRLIMSGALATPNLQLLSGGRAVSVPHVAPLTSASETCATDTEYLLQAFRSGSGFRIQHLQHFLPCVNRFCQLVAAEIGHQIGANAYFSPKDSKGLAPHYDNSDVFVLQVAGSKHWRLFPDYSNQQDLPLHESQFSPSRHIPGSPAESLLMRQGDVLYIPRGRMHDAYTDDDFSIHLTFAVIGLSWADVLTRALRDAAQNDEHLRELVPLGILENFSDEALAQSAEKLIRAIEISDTLETVIRQLRLRISENRKMPEPGALLSFWT